MRHRMILHPDSPPSPVEQIHVEVARTWSGNMVFHFIAVGEAAAVRIPPPAAAERSDGLWQTTCFEAFVRPPGEAYAEYNFSPSGRWAAYRFATYREGMAPLASRPPRLDFRRAEQSLRLVAAVPAAPGFDQGRLALSAVIEDQAGRKSYWALAFPDGAPDFHHVTCFDADLEAAGRS